MDQPLPPLHWSCSLAASPRQPAWAELRTGERSRAGQDRQSLGGCEQPQAGVSLPQCQGKSREPAAGEVMERLGQVGWGCRV